MRYKDLCKYFKEPQKQGGARQSQIEKWKKTHDIEYNNREYKIIRKYTKEEIEHNQMRGKYIKLFSMVLSNLLLQSDKNCVSYSMMEMLYFTHMVNSDYREIRYNVDGAAIVLDTDPNQLELYSTKSYNLLSRLVKDMLEQLSDRSLIIYRKGFRLYQNYETYTETKDIQIGSTDESMILSIEQSTMKAMGLDSLAEVYKSEKNTSKFKKQTREKAKIIFDGWDGYYSIYHITLNKDGLKEYNISTYAELNSNISDKLLTSKALCDITELPKMVQASIDLSRPYKIKEKLKGE